MSRVQSPVISTALREVLSLDGSGAFPMDADGTIVPVAIVADIRKELTSQLVPAWQSATRAPVVGESSIVGCVWDPGALDRVTSHIEITKVRIHSSTAGDCYVGVLEPFTLAPGLQSPRRKIASLQGSSLAARVGSSTTPVAATTFLPNIAAVLRLVSAVDTVMEFDEPVVLDRAGSGLCVIHANTNTTLYGSFEWTEVRR